MKAIELPPLSEQEKAELDELYRKTRDVRLRTRAQMILLAGEKDMVAREIGEIVRQSEPTVRRWLKRYRAEGVNGLQDNPRPGAPSEVSGAFKDRLVIVVRQRPRSLGQPYSMWTLQRLADFMAEETGQRVSPESIRRYLKAVDIVLSRPQHKISSPDAEYEVKKRWLKTREIA